MFLGTTDATVLALVHRYVAQLGLPSERLWLTTERGTYATWIGRRVPSAYGGAYCFIRRKSVHAILINLARIDRQKTFAVEVVVVEELVHMRDHIDGDRRRHARHGYDRIAMRVSQLTGVSMEDIRLALIPPKRRSLKYLYECPGCHIQINRRIRGRWSCGWCASGFDHRFVLRLVGS